MYTVNVNSKKIYCECEQYEYILSLTLDTILLYNTESLFLPQEAGLVAFGSHGGAEVNHQAKHLLPKQHPARGAILWDRLHAWPPGIHTRDEEKQIESGEPYLLK